MIRSFLLFAIPIALSSGWLPDLRADEKPRMLFLTQSEGFVHTPVKRGEGHRSSAELAMMQLAKSSGEFTVYCSQNAEADVTRENLESFDIVAFYTTGALPIDEADLDHLLGEWLTKKGHGFIGFHSATDTYKKHEPYWDMIGGIFNGHPWGQDSKVKITVHDKNHPTMRPFGKRFDFQDEIYQYEHWQPEKVHVLMSLDMKRTEKKRPYHVPVAWCKQVGDGRMFYNNLGHREETWQDQRFLDSIVAAVRWINGDEDGDATPNPEVSARQDKRSRKHSHAAGVTLESLAAAEKARRAARAKREAEKKAATAD